MINDNTIEYVIDRELKSGKMDILDCIIVGGGPAGLNAAVVLGRSCRKVIVFDTGNQRNKKSQGMHNYLTRDGILPPDFLKIARKELEKYGIQFISKMIVKASKISKGYFEVCDDKGKTYYAKKMLVATGLSDTIPAIEGIHNFYGRSVFHCPYCDGWEVKDKKLGVYAHSKDGSELSLALKGWSNEVMLFTDGKVRIRSAQKEKLSVNKITIISSEISHLEGSEGQLKKIICSNGDKHDCDALFLVNGYTQQCNIAEAFGCEVNKKGVVITNRYQQTKIDGLYVAGDADKDMQFVVVAAAEGAKAGVIINKELQKETTLKKSVRNT